MLNNQISQAQSILKHGGVIAYSTETVLGLGCNPQLQEAVNRILWLKNRAVENGLIVVVDNLEALHSYTQALNKEHINVISTTKHTTWLIPKNDTVPNWISGTHNKVAVRITDHAVAGPLASATNGIISTSANVSSYKTLTSQEEIRDWFGPHVDYMIIGDVGTEQPSQIIDLLTGEKLR